MNAYTVCLPAFAAAAAVWSITTPTISHFSLCGVLLVEATVFAPSSSSSHGGSEEV